MYEAHFGLKSRPFGATAEGPAVFSGPLQASTISSLHKALAAPDAVVSITGPVGVGKTTIAGHALASISPGRMAAWVGRMSLAPDEVLDLLLAGFGVNRKVEGSLRRFAAFRRLLAERTATGAPVAIVVEDAVRIGPDALVELEALTAADNGDTNSGNIILMGSPELNKMLADPALARLQQRMRLRHKVEPLSAVETAGYMQHCIRMSGGEFEAVFAPGVANIVADCSGGIPRMINTLCESALTAAMEDGEQRISAERMHQVAVAAFGYEGPIPDVSDAEIIEPDSELPLEAPESDAAPAESNKPVEIIAADHDASNYEDDIIVESGRFPALPDREAQVAKASSVDEVSVPQEDEAPDELADQPETVSDSDPDIPHYDEESSEPESIEQDELEIPELINDTQPALTALDEEQNVSHTAHEAETDLVAGEAAAPESAAVSSNAATNSADTDDEFSLDAALAVDVEQTNLMENVTPALDEMAAADGDESKVHARDNPALPDNLPTLSESMQVNVRKEVVQRETARDIATPEISDESASKATETTLEASDVDTESESDQTPRPAEAQVVDAELESAIADVLANVEPSDIAAGDQAGADEQENPAPSDDGADTETASRTTEDESLIGSANDETAPVAPDQKTSNVADALSLETADERSDSGRPDTDADEQPFDVIEESGSGSEADAALAAAVDEVAASLDNELELALVPDLPEEAAVESEETAPPATSALTEKIAAIDPTNPRNDVDALEAALEAAKSDNMDAMMAEPELPQVALDSANREGAGEQDSSKTDLPAITLDDELAKTQPSPEELAKMTEEIANAESLNDFTDSMAETIFGDESFNAIAAAVIANPPPVPETGAVASSETASLKLEEPLADVQVEDPSAPPANDAPTLCEKMRQSQLMRADMLSNLNQPDGPTTSPGDREVAAGEVVPTSPDAATPAVDAAPATQSKKDKAAPDSIEDQFETSMTQNLEALDVSRVADKMHEDDDEEEAPKKRGGLFARFRRS